MRLEFSVGRTEHHRVVFEFDQFWGRLTIDVDGRRLVRTIRTLSLRPTVEWTFAVGDQEMHTLRIEKRRPWFFAGFRPQTVRAYVDGELVVEKSTGP